MMEATRWALVKRVFQAALDRPPAERTAFVRATCGSDAALYSEVESLLTAHGQAGSFAERPAVPCPDLSVVESGAAGAEGRRLQPGERFGAYEIRTFLAAGGMGEVYRAYDPTLGREVAIKVLPIAFTADPDRLARFEREARVLASLNHPNVAAIYGVDQADGVRALVLELVEGDTLGERLARAHSPTSRTGGLPTREILDIARQIADALDVAHAQGIVHRDLKPGNVKITPGGVVKVLDFGLAKVAAGLDRSHAPTVAVDPTGEGLIVGTVPYMSPEQARGQPVDKRTDVWAFGCVLYEMFAGVPPFRGPTVSDTIANILEHEPDWTVLPPNTPAAIRRLLRRCLAKDCRRRLSDIGDARLEIEDAQTAPTDEHAATTAVPVPGSKPRRALIGAATLGLFAAAAAVVWVATRTGFTPTPSQPLIHTVISLPPGERLAESNQPVVALSPDGRQLAYVAVQGGVQQLYLRAMESPKARAIAGSEGAHTPFFSPDGQWLGFFAGGALKKIPVNGGAPVTLAEAPQPGGATWGRQGMIVFEPQPGPLQQVSDAGGTTQPMTRLGEGEAIHFLPEFLPDGSAVLFNGAPPTRLAIYSIETGERRDLLQGGLTSALDLLQPRYISSGHLVYGRAGTLMAATFDPRRLEMTGTAVPVLEGVLSSSFNGVHQYSVSATGTLVYLSGGIAANQSRLVWVSRNGTEQPLVAPVRAYRTPRISPDGRRIAMGIDDQGSHTWVYDFSRETLTRLTFDGRISDNPIWTPDGQRIAFSSDREGVNNVFWQLADGSGGVERLTTSQSPQLPLSFSSDGQELAFRYAPRTDNDIWVLRLSDGQARPLFQSPFLEVVAQFSPDGRWLAYVSDESGRWEVYVRAHPGPGGKWQVSTEGGTEPMWNPNGRELFYRSGDKMMAVAVTTQPGFSAATPQVLFGGAYLPTGGTLPNYDVAPDGLRLLMLKPIEQTEETATQINVVQNWLEELKRLVPTN